MIYRKILKVKTTGSRQTGDLRPTFNLPKGFNMVVHEYNTSQKWCIIEVWCSDNILLDPIEQKTKADLDLLAQDETVLSIETSHPLSPTILGAISVSGHSLPIEKFDEKKKTVTVKGKTIKYLQKTKAKDTANQEMDVYLLDEG